MELQEPIKNTFTEMVKKELESLEQDIQFIVARCFDHAVKEVREHMRISLEPDGNEFKVIAHYRKIKPADAKL